MAIKASTVFVPGAFPEHTYVQREDRAEDALRDALTTPGQLVSLVGPSKSGKTVLVERVVGESLIPISGASISRPDDVWDRALDWMDVPNSTSTGSTSTTNFEAEVAGKAEAGLPLFAKGEFSGGLTGGVGAESARGAVRERRGLPQVVEEIGNSDFVVLIDDFHYIARDVQVEVAKTLKEAIRLGVKVITAAVSYRGDDVVRANPELRGRVRSLDLKYWTQDELRVIPLTGFEILNVDFPTDAMQVFVEESAGSPQLMQQMCLQACFVLDARVQNLLKNKVDVPEKTLRTILEQTSTTTDFRSLVDVLDDGPRTRGTERKTYKFKDGTTGDVYRAVLKAAANSPPRLSFAYDQLVERIGEICADETPVGSSVISTCNQMSILARDKFPRERAIDWDEQKQVLDIPDPYLMFYLRWSGRLDEQED